MNTEFEPATDSVGEIEDDDTPIESSARFKDHQTLKKRLRILVVVLIAAGLALVASGQEPLRVAISMAAMYLLLRAGFATIGAFARPIPEPPPPGELRKVKVLYRCSSCGTELRMTLSDDETPRAPRHCADEMDVMTPPEL